MPDLDEYSVFQNYFPQYHQLETFGQSSDQRSFSPSVFYSPAQQDSNLTEQHSPQEEPAQYIFPVAPVPVFPAHILPQAIQPQTSSIPETPNSWIQNQNEQPPNIEQFFFGFNPEPEQSQQEQYQTVQHAEQQNDIQTEVKNDYGDQYIFMAENDQYYEYYTVPVEDYDAQNGQLIQPVSYLSDGNPENGYFPNNPEYFYPEENLQEEANYLPVYSYPDFSQDNTEGTGTMQMCMIPTISHPPPLQNEEILTDTLASEEDTFLSSLQLRQLMKSKEEKKVTKITDKYYKFSKVINGILKKRMKTVSRSQVSRCNQCDSYSLSKDCRGIFSFMKQHVFTHVQKYPHSCNICGTYESTNASKVKAHIGKVHGKKGKEIDEYMTDRRRELDQLACEWALKCYQD